MFLTGGGCGRTHQSSPGGSRRSDRGSPSYSGHSEDLRHLLCTDTSRWRRRSGLRSPSPRDCRRNLPTQRRNTTCCSSLQNQVFQHRPKVKLILTYAGVGPVHAAAGVGLVSRGTLVTLWSHRVVRAVVADASASPAAGLVHGLVKVTALGVVVALASCPGSTVVSTEHTLNDADI